MWKCSCNRSLTASPSSSLSLGGRCSYFSWLDPCMEAVGMDHRNPPRGEDGWDTSLKTGSVVSLPVGPECETEEQSTMSASLSCPQISALVTLTFTRRWDEGVWVMGLLAHSVCMFFYFSKEGAAVKILFYRSVRPLSVSQLTQLSYILVHCFQQTSNGNQN